MPASSSTVIGCAIGYLSEATLIAFVVPASDQVGEVLAPKIR